MSDHRWQGYTHAELFEMLHQGPGPEASDPPARRWSELGRALEDIDSGMTAALRAAAEGWEGRASESARAALSPLGEWAGRAREAAERMRSCSEQQAECVAKARAEMPPPVEVRAEEPSGLTSALVHLFGGQTDYEQQERQQDAAEQRAFDVMRTYQASSEANATSLASFEQPPQLVVDVPRQPGPAGTSMRDVTISWGALPSGGTASAPGSPTGAGGSRSPGPGRDPGTHSSGATRGDPAHARGGHAGGRVSSGRAGDEEDGEPVVEVTETAGEAGPFDEQRTYARPVIGGDSG
ncbi:MULTISPECIES: PPE domain-containing protein [unclassified Actinopolyspora]|uniref:PPE domain-containing protein n=1 Tax=unclassified Actinopolyspora TaxID=2639451 RepID=UPI0013F63EC8|nr:MULTISPECIES: PPE domain-containing protein [unclassified Actinopolyspora]NHD19053.1 PPE domain-containing protein [Actinopolyspora sp. BKK2]NHE78162.1 PPE domain-containing protein [Actinopolyspora sp. BKK1]